MSTHDNLEYNHDRVNSKINKSEPTTPQDLGQPAELLDNGQGKIYNGLCQPLMDVTGIPVIGKDRAAHRKENKRRRQALQAMQP